MKRVVIVGAGGFGGEVAWVLRRMQAAGEALRLEGFCDDASDCASGTRHGAALLGTIEQAAAIFAGKVWFHVAVGGNRARQELAQRALGVGWSPLTVVDPTAVVADDAAIGAGCYIGALAVVSQAAVLGDFAIVNLQATIGHEAVIGAATHVCPGARVSGRCVIGARALLGSNAVVIPGVNMGDDATIGPNASALRDVAAGATVARLR